MDTPITTTNCRMVHGLLLTDKENTYSAVVANIKDVTTNESKLWIVRSPVRPVWVTRKALRKHQDKRLCVPECEVDQFQCPEHQVPAVLQKALYGYSRQNAWRSMLLDSPYVYGADVSPVVIYAKQLKDQCPRGVGQYKIGHLDIETSVCGGNEVILISYTNYDGTVYQGVLQSFLQGQDPKIIEERFKSKLVEFRDKLLPVAQKVLDKFQWKYEQYVAEDELSLIRWIFKIIHREKPDFVGIWNMGFDVPYLINRIRSYNIFPETIMCHPDVPMDLWVCEYREDTKDVEHFTDKWDWFRCSGYTQFIDSMCLYSRLRKVVGREISYTLQYIASKNIGTGKLEFGDNDTHFTMQTQRFLDYGVYNIFDSVVLFIMERVNDDIPNMMNLADCSELQCFARQTLMLKDAFYIYCRERGLVMGTVSKSTAKEWDDRIHNIGGAVLDPERAKGTGVPILQESNNISKLHRLVFDLDVTAISQWPARQQCCVYNLLNCWKSLKPKRLQHKDETCLNVIVKNVWDRWVISSRDPNRIGFNDQSNRSYLDKRYDLGKQEAPWFLTRVMIWSVLYGNV